MDTRDYYITKSGRRITLAHLSDSELGVIIDNLAIEKTEARKKYHEATIQFESCNTARVRRLNAKHLAKQKELLAKRAAEKVRPVLEPNQRKFRDA